MSNQNNKKNKLIFVCLIVIILVLLVGIIYQFVVIKNMERTNTSNNVVCIQTDYSEKVIFF